MVQLPVRWHKAWERKFMNVPRVPTSRSSFPLSLSRPNFPSKFIFPENLLCGISLAIGNYKRGFFQSVASAKNGCTNTDSENWRGVEGHSLPRAVSDPSPERNWVNSQSNSSLSLHYHLMSCCYLLLQIFSHFSLYMFVIKV